MQLRPPTLRGRAGSLLVLALVFAAATTATTDAQPLSTSRSHSASNPPRCYWIRSRPNRANLKRIERATLCLINRARMRHGLGPLTADVRLAKAARAHSSEMVRSNYVGDISSAGATVSERLAAAGYVDRHNSSAMEVGEILGTGTGPFSTPASIVHAWMISAPHREILLGASFRADGIGVVAAAPSSSVRGYRCPCATYTADLGTLP